LHEGLIQLGRAVVVLVLAAVTSWELEMIGDHPTKIAKVSMVTTPPQQSPPLSTEAPKQLVQEEATATPIPEDVPPPSTPPTEDGEEHLAYDPPSIPLGTRLSDVRHVYRCGNTTFSKGKSHDGLEINADAPSFLYQRKEPREYLLKDVRVACLYAGFLRDYRRMMRDCIQTRGKKICKKERLRKFYGNQEDAILEPLDCDVFITTWDIFGKGRYSTRSYDLEDKVKPHKVCEDYGDRLAGFHIQTYTAYGDVWKKMAAVPRNFTEAYPRERPNQATGNMWKAYPKYNSLFRVNDYSQSYKHWALVKLADASTIKYDLYFRLRTDLRTSKKFVPGSLFRVHYKKYPAFQFRLTEDRRLHVVHPSRIHTHGPDITDFGFMGLPEQMRHLASIWPRLCLGPATKPGELVLDESDYNRVLWQQIFDRNWLVDFGLTYLHISRRYGESMV
jgi:hypothetical protein